MHTPGSLASNSKVAEMMRRMNYREGSGLGKYGQGIIAPIEVIVRPKRAGLGFAEGSSNTRGAHWSPPTAEWNDAATRVQKMLGFGGQTARLLRDAGALDEGKELVGALAAITKAMMLLQVKSEWGKLTTGVLIGEFMRLKNKFPEEYKTYCLAETAGALAAPLLRPVFQGWEPVRDPARGLEVVHLLKNILDDASTAMSPYAALVNDVVVPAVRASEWEAIRDYEPMVGFMETWEHTLPPSAVQSIMETVVMPKLAAAVESWEPGWETVPCHVWVSPWEELVDRYVVPNLRQSLRELQVTPPKQKDGTFGQVMKWAPLVPAQRMLQLLEAEFFGKWKDALHGWLRAARPKEGEAVAWYEGWKRLFTPELLADERVRVALEAALDMIYSAAQGACLCWN